MDLRDEVRHLGPVLPRPGAGAPGGDARGRIIALGTSAVFADASLVRQFTHTDAVRLDSGFQAHLYTRPGDVLVVQVPPTGRGDAAVLEGDAVEQQVASALDAGCAMWRVLWGVELLAPTGRVVIAGTAAQGAPLAPGLQHPGGLLDAAAACWRAGAGSLLAFVLDDALVARLGIDPGASPQIARRARATTDLMDKNVAMATLSAAGVPCARTWTVDDGDPRALLGRLRSRGRGTGPGRYVFKPAGGAAGVGVHGGRGGVDVDALARHVADLQASGLLPRRFQVQELVPGDVLGVDLWIDGAGGYEVWDVHRAVHDASGRFVGASWLRAEQPAMLAATRSACAGLARAVDVPMLVGLDVVGGRVIEVNPRITAAAPIAHLLRSAPTSARGHRGATRVAGIERIDLDTRVPVSPAAIATGRVESAALAVRDRYGALVLPQGLNPFGLSRVVVVDDAPDGRGRAAFRALVGG